MLRTNESYLLSWLNSNPRKPLVIRGARQVGKSTLVRDFSKRNGLTLHELNLERHQGLRDTIKALDVAAFLSEVQLICKLGSPQSPDSLLFIDEIQAIPEALSLLRYLYEEVPDLPIIAAGSLLEFALADESKNFSMPVGRIEYAFLGPCTFDEFLAGLGENELLSYIRAYSLQDKFLTTAHEKLLHFLRLYLRTGGMPEALQTYIDTRDLNAVNKVHRSIISTYRDDFSKYARRVSFIRLGRVLDYLPSNVGRKVKYVAIDPESKSADVKDAISMLEMSGLILTAYVSDATSAPLAAKRNHRVYKIYLLDCGLLNAFADLSMIPTQFSDRFINEDCLAEQFIAQHLAYSNDPYVKPSLHYWLREGRVNNAEVDFLIQHDAHIIPVEVKSGSSGTLKSLHQFISRAEKSTALRFDLNTPSVQALEGKLTSNPKEIVRTKLVSLPLYMVSEARRLLS